MAVEVAEQPVDLLLGVLVHVLLEDSHVVLKLFVLAQKTVLQLPEQHVLALLQQFKVALLNRFPHIVLQEVDRLVH